MPPRKKLKQTTNNGINYIDSLPVEILCMVYDRLDLADVKNASLVSKGWNKIIFFSGYVGRFVYTIDACCHMKSLEHQDLANIESALTKGAISIAMHSQRCYRHLKCKILQFDGPALPSLWDPLYTDSRWTNNLRSLSFSFAYPCELAQLLLSIADATSKMPILHSLTLESSAGRGSEQDSVTILRSNSVKHLEIRKIYKIGIDMPQLQTLKCPFSNICHSANITQSHALGNLKHLSLTEEKDYDFWENLTQTELSPIRRLIELETFELASHHKLLCIRTFIAILKTFTKLKAVSLDILYSSTRICSNPNGVWFDPGPSESPMHLDFSQLTKLEQLKMISSEYDSLKLPKTVKILSLYVDEKIYYRNFVETILKCNMQLIELKLLFAHQPFGYTHLYPPPKILKILPLVKNLVLLSFENGVFRKSDFLCIETSLNHLRKLQFLNCKLETKEFLGLKEKFPNLKTLDFSYCHFYGGT